MHAPLEFRVGVGDGAQSAAIGLLEVRIAPEVIVVDRKDAVLLVTMAGSEDGDSSPGQRLPDRTFERG